MPCCFPPITNHKTEIVILGSFPGRESLRKQEYYGHKQNQFWKLIGACIEEKLHDLPYQRKLAVLTKYRIGLWDVLDSCERKGSLDSNIRNGKQNDFSTITRLQNLKRVCFNGKTAARHREEFSEVECAVLPSSSPANTLRFDKKLAVWKQAIKRSKS